MKKRYLGLLAMSTVLTLGLVAVNEYRSNVVDAAEEAVTQTISIKTVASQNGWGNQGKYSSFTWNEDVTCSVTAGTNTGKYYTNDNSWRLYANETAKLTVSVGESCTLSSISLTYSVKDNGKISLNNTALTSGKSVSVSGSSVQFAVGSTSGSKGKVFITGISVSYTKTVLDAPVGEVANVAEINTLIGNYYAEGYYIKDTTINLTSDAVNELLTYDNGFHNDASDLVRTTYFTPQDLWMTNNDGVNSGYGTDSNGNLTHFTYRNGVKYNEVIASVKPNDISGTNWTSSENGMEGYYLTLKDINATESQEWMVCDEVYSSSDEELIELFKAITAPCYKGFKNDLSNYIIFSGVEVEETEDGLELRLLASEGNEGALVSGSKLVFSRAIIREYEEIPETAGAVVVEETSFELSGHNLAANAAKADDITEFFKLVSPTQYVLDDYLDVELVKLVDSASGFGFYANYRLYTNTKLVVSVKDGYVITSIEFVDFDTSKAGSVSITGQSDVSVNSNPGVLSYEDGINLIEIINTSGEQFRFGSLIITIQPE